jgi:hypothetical protein
MALVHSRKFGKIRPVNDIMFTRIIELCIIDHHHKRKNPIGFSGSEVKGQGHIII